MLKLQRIISSFSGVKSLKTTAISVPSKGLKVTHQSGTEIEIESPLEVYISALAACEYETLKVVLKQHEKVKLTNVKFTRIESTYDLKHWQTGGGKGNQVGDIYIEAEAEISATQSELDQIMKKVEKLCPVYQMISSSGVKIHSIWKSKKADLL